MKEIFLTTVIAFSVFMLNAQNEKPTQYIFGNNGKITVNGFGAPIVEFSSKGGSIAVSTGGGGAVLLNQTFYIGAYGMGLATEHDLEGLKVMQSNGEIINYPTMRTSFGHGGFWLGYIHNRKDAFHWVVSTKIGWGSIDLVDADFEKDSHTKVGLDQVFVLTPQIEMEMNLTRWFKINIGAGYRYVSGVDKTYLNEKGETLSFYKSSDFNSPQASISFLFGGFGR
ncbi:MAG: hypothetical protein HXX18_00640 [Bacteroidetes bacterium]|nr:hypothetical protein [Bacteroidota bacterium]